MSEHETCWIEIDTGAQRLLLHQDGRVALECEISTGARGVGERRDSECTPRGVHAIAEKIGAGAPENTVFVGRRATGERYSPELRRAHPDRDWILTRILWLRGTEAGRNLGGEVDTQSRYIYIHGTPDDVPLGTPGSRGCIRMRNRDLVDLFERVDAGTRVLIR